MLRVIAIIPTAIIIAMQQQPQYYQTANAFPCVGNATKEYCVGYHDGAIQAHRDFNSGLDVDISTHRCSGSIQYCNGYDRGYSDEADFLG